MTTCHPAAPGTIDYGHIATIVGKEVGNILVPQRRATQDIRNDVGHVSSWSPTWTSTTLPACPRCASPFGVHKRPSHGVSTGDKLVSVRRNDEEVSISGDGDGADGDGAESEHVGLSEEEEVLGKCPRQPKVLTRN